MECWISLNLPHIPSNSLPSATPNWAVCSLAAYIASSMFRPLAWLTLPVEGISKFCVKYRRCRGRDYRQKTSVRTRKSFKNSCNCPFAKILPPLSVFSGSLSSEFREKLIYRRIELLGRQSSPRSIIRLWRTFSVILWYLPKALCWRTILRFIKEIKLNHRYGRFF